MCCTPYVSEGVSRAVTAAVGNSHPKWVIDHAQPLAATSDSWREAHATESSSGFQMSRRHWTEVIIQFTRGMLVEASRYKQSIKFSNVWPGIVQGTTPRAAPTEARASCRSSTTSTRFEVTTLTQAEILPMLLRSQAHRSLRRRPHCTEEARHLMTTRGQN